MQFLSASTGELLASFDWRVERDFDLCGWCEPNKPTHSDTASQKGKRARVLSRVGKWSCTVARICFSGLSYLFVSCNTYFWTREWTLVHMSKVTSKHPKYTRINY